MPDTPQRGGSLVSERIFLGLGSNLGDRLDHLRQAIESLQDKGVRIVRLSAVYDTDPVGYRAQGNFLNLVAEVDWQASPRELLERCQAVERERGRARAVRDGPRTLDLDLLLFGDRILKETDLTLPHPRMHERRFVLQPLAELAPLLRHPVLGMTVGTLLERCADSAGVRQLPVRLSLERDDPPGYNPAASRGKPE
ncbi:MAG TPA: 2-amino-4-hydroxy-6-hydroxymethyldihydropteridine diphosphokinase [Candidatus Polarisedimenticolia bacterium]|jgi:2-amino-4-hydroxy-6-hydroxymethyldihydropteridine diphosphokinase|nr:2-amino-4-hydroxy-6-hydroxymethyldihydropteridine diphosphokinase [Candidatus Polarisedimenticolia bacterium]